jgi:hypothetical protein
MSKTVSKLTLTANLVLAMSFTILTSCASNPPAETAPASSQGSQQSLEAELKAAATPSEKAEILTRAAQDATAEAAKAKANAEAKTAAAEKAPGMLKSKAEKEAREAQAIAAAAQAKAELLAKQAAEATALAAAEKAVDAVTESPESAPAAE